MLMVGEAFEMSISGGCSESMITHFTLTHGIEETREITRE